MADEYLFDPQHLHFNNGRATMLPAQFVDDTPAHFESGAMTDSLWDVLRGRLELVLGKSTGEFTSHIFDAGAPVRWDTIAWNPSAPYGKALPALGVHESGYVSGNLDMSGNILIVSFR
ncbi:MAG: hypothetical protein HY696_09260 [Deltaproteobacteria bacterium]|nr:hypothetical protein [Deltaproteobacteria bacterium]